MCDSLIHLRVLTVMQRWKQSLVDVFVDAPWSKWRTIPWQSVDCEHGPELRWCLALVGGRPQPQGFCLVGLHRVR